MLRVAERKQHSQPIGETGKAPPVRAAVSLLLAMIVAAVVGCGPERRETVPVTGRVMVGGQSLASGTITFWPDDGGPPAGGSIGADGTYRLTTYKDGDGAVLGTHKVTVQAEQVSETASAPKSINEEMKSRTLYSQPPVQVRQLVPARYAMRQSTNLTAEVGRDTGSLDFDLVVDH